MALTTADPPLPWLVLQDGSTFFSFPSSTSLPFPDAAGYHGSCNNYLLFNLDDGGDGGYLLVNPFTGDTVRLPSLSSIRFVVKGGTALPWRAIADDRRAPCGETTVRKVVMCHGGDGKLVAAIVGDGKLGKIAMCRAGEGSSSRWVMSGHDVWRWINDIAFYDGKVYAVEDNGNLFAMDAGEEDRHTGEPMVAWAKMVIKVSDDVPARRRRKEKAPPSMRYLLVSGGRLMMVHRAVAAAAMSDGGATTTKLEVFKAELVSRRWVKMTSVGDDIAIFVGRWSSFALRVYLYKLPGNRIHFLDDDAFRRCSCSDDKFGSYDMADGKIYPLLPSMELCNGTGSTPVTWLFPREQEGVLTWRDLPSDVFGLVLRRLHRREDRVHLSEVCRDWCLSTRKHLRRRPWALPPAPTVAMATTAVPPPQLAATVAYLALPNGLIFRYPELTPQLFHENAAGAGGSSYLAAACDDWLLFSDAGGLFHLTSPFTGKTILLPSFHNVHADDKPVEIINNEPSPTHHESATTTTAVALWRDDETMAVRKLVVCPDGFIAAIFGGEHSSKVVLCSLATFSWSHSVHDGWRRYHDLAFHGGKLYAVTAGADLLAIDVGVDSETGEPSISRVERLIAGNMTSISSFHYLVPSVSDELLMVRRWFPSYSVVRRSRVAVFRANLASSRWEVVSNLGGHGEALFVGRMCSRAVSGCRRQRGGEVFFLPDDCVGMWSWEPRRADHHAAVYDMWTETVTDILPRQMPQDDGPSMTTWLFTTEP